MKSWQIILINACVTVFAVFAAIALFLPDAPADKTTELREALSQQIDGIQLKLGAVEDAISKQKKQASLTTTQREPVDNSESLSKLNQKLDMVLGKLSVLENKNTSTQSPRSFGRSFGPPMVPPQLPPSLSGGGQNPSTWIDSLSDDKKLEVEIVFEEHAAWMRENLAPPDPNGKLPDRETIGNVVKEGDRLLKQDLKAILSGEEYQQFLDSHPEPRVPFSKPSAVQRNP
ncbi:MAG: hypothetical protein K9N10_00630 [Deltaproteobacteria bacterium]|nr:hypothetical protein [Deltaproteobacteria bacterium]